jgi:predicted transcriptional regulator
VPARRIDISADDGAALGVAAPATAVPGPATARSAAPGSAIIRADRSDAAPAGTAARSQPKPGPPGTAVTSAESPGPADAAPVAGPAARREAAAAVQREAAAAAQRDPTAVRAFIERFATHLTQAGFPRTPARIFVALLTSDSSKLTAAELGEVLQASPATISGGVRYLIQVGLAAAQGEPGSRRLHYWVSEQVWRDIVRVRDRMFTSWAAELRLGIGVLGPQSPAGVRMAETASYFEFISAEMAGLVARWEARTADGPAPGTGGTAPGTGGTAPGT